MRHRLSNRGPTSRARWWFPSIWLVYLGLPIYSMLQDATVKAAPGLCFLAVFVGLYVSGHRWKNLALANGLGMIAITAAMSFLFDPMMLTLGFYTVSIAAFALIGSHRLALHAAQAVMVGAVLLLNGSSLSSDEWVNLIPPLIIIFVFPFAFSAIRRSRVLREELDTANRRIKALIQQEERERIARDLHDTLGQTLTLISLKSEFAEKSISRNPQQAREEVSEIRQTARAALKQIRELVTDMQALRLADEILQAEKVLHTAGITFVYKEGEDPNNVPSVVGHVLAFCLRETITNVVRHSGATRCEVELFQEDGRAGLIVTDNGRGLVRSQERHAASGNGLRNMQERLEFVGGLWTAEPEASGGTKMILSVPLAEKANA